MKLTVQEFDKILEVQAGIKKSCTDLFSDMYCKPAECYTEVLIEDEEVSVCVVVEIDGLTIGELASFSFSRQDIEEMIVEDSDG